jgi:hypothetical protein
MKIGQQQFPVLVHLEKKDVFVVSYYVDRFRDRSLFFSNEFGSMELAQSEVKKIPFEVGEVRCKPSGFAL